MTHDLNLQRPNMILLAGHIFSEFMPSVSSEAFVVMMRLIYQHDMYHEETEYFGSTAKFLELTGLTLPQLKRALDELAELGYANYDFSNNTRQLRAIGIIADDYLEDDEEEEDDDND